MNKAIIFDLDDTLISEYDYVLSGFYEVDKYLKQECGINCYELLIQLFSKDKQNVFNRLLAKISLNDDMFLKNIINIYRNNQASKVKFYDDVLPFIRRAKESGIKTGIITDGRIEGQQAKLKAVKADAYFDKVIITDSLGGTEYRKPNPKAFEIMKDFFDIKFEEMVYIGDNPEKDFYIEKTHGVKTIQILRLNTMYSNKQYLNDYKPKALVESLNEILKE